MILMNSEKTVESACVLGNPDISMAESSVFQDCGAGQPFKPLTGESTVFTACFEGEVPDWEDQRDISVAY